MNWYQNLIRDSKLLTQGLSEPEFYDDYRNVPKFSDWANSVDPDQTAPRAGSTLFAIRSALFGHITVMILSFRTDMPGQTVQTQIRLLLEQGLHCLPFGLHFLDTLP